MEGFLEIDSQQDYENLPKIDIAQFRFACCGEICSNCLLAEGAVMAMKILSIFQRTVSVALAIVLAGWIGSMALAEDKPAGGSDKPKSRADWPTERVTVIGRRGNTRDWLSNHTFRGTEGFSDGSAPADVGSRYEFYWQIYYQANGRLEAHYQRLASRTPHGPIEELGFEEFGTWRINEEGDLCQSIPKVGYGLEMCYWVDRRGDRMAMYYTKCGAFNRCYPGRLGPEGEIVRGRAFTR